MWRDVMYHPVFQLTLGCAMALSLYAYRKWVDTGAFDYKSEAKVLALPALSIFAAMVFSGVDYSTAAIAALTSFGVALGLNRSAAK